MLINVLIRQTDNLALRRHNCKCHVNGNYPWNHAGMFKYLQQIADAWPAWNKNAKMQSSLIEHNQARSKPLFIPLSGRKQKNKLLDQQNI